jgi:hypothetical protein
MGNLNELCGFYHDPNVGGGGGVNLPWSGEHGQPNNHVEKPKFFGGSFKTL